MLVFLAPIVGSILVVRAVSSLLLRPPGWTGFTIWVLQAAVIGACVSLLIDRGSRRALPLATLFSLSLVFPDEAPSRFSIALRTGSAKQLQRRTAELKDKGLGATPNEAAIRALEIVGALGKHDRLTRGHTERVRAYADMIGTELNLREEDRIRLSWGALLHDIGKLAVPTEVLSKQEQLSDAEWELLKRHPAASDSILKPLSAWLGPWARAASEHHERWDGTGYPNRLSGLDISLAGRITAVADAFDVITSKRSYKEALSPEAARKELVDCARNRSRLPWNLSGPTLDLWTSRLANRSTHRPPGRSDRPWSRRCGRRRLHCLGRDAGRSTSPRITSVDRDRDQFPGQLESILHSATAK